VTVPDFASVPRTAAGSMHYGFGDLAYDFYEQIPALTFPMSTQTYARMRRDPQISSVLKAYTYPLRSATYAINPKGCRDEVAEFVADAWGLPIEGDNDGPGPARRRGVRWKEHMRMALLMLTFGFSPFAIRYEVGGTPVRARLAELSERLPQTITDIRINDDGSIKEVYQLGSRKPIDGSALLWYSHEREGASWQGRSMLIDSYGPWLLKHEMWRVLASSSRRFGMGIPQVTAPPGGTPADIANAATLASGYRAGDQSGVGLPNGYQFDLKGMSGSVPDTMAFINYLDAQIATSVLAEVLNLDTASTGNRALGDTVIGLLQMSWQAVAESLADTATGMNVQMVDYNFGEDEPVPGLLCTDINRPEVTSEAISALVTCGALTPDLGLENDIRLRFNLPLLSEQERDAALPDPTPAVPDSPVAIVSPDDVPDVNSSLAP
jgi:hypothetical protein